MRGRFPLSAMCLLPVLRLPLHRRKRGISDGLNTLVDTVDEGHENGSDGEFDRISKSTTKPQDELDLNKEGNDDCDCSQEEKIKTKRGQMSKSAAPNNYKPARKRKNVPQEPDKPLLSLPRGSLAQHDEKDVWSSRLRSRKKILTFTSCRLRAYSYGESIKNEKRGNKARQCNHCQLMTGLITCSRKTLHTLMRHLILTKREMSGNRQFGTDLSMIQLFPCRTLEQIRKKYKNEQKRNPMTMHDAQTSIATDHSCFELVIKTLEAAREDERRYAYNEADVTRAKSKEGHPEKNSETNESANSEHNLNDEAADKEPHIGSPGNEAIEEVYYIIITYKIQPHDFSPNAIFCHFRLPIHQSCLRYQVCKCGSAEFRAVSPSNQYCGFVLGFGYIGNA